MVCMLSGRSYVGLWGLYRWVLISLRAQIAFCIDSAETAAVFFRLLVAVNGSVWVL